MQNKTLIFFTKSRDLVFFLAIVFVSLFLPLLKPPLSLQITLILGAWGLGGVVFFLNRELLAPVLFFLLNAILTPLSLYLMRDFQVSISNLYFLPAILVYLGLIISSRGLRQKIGWLRWGRIDRNSWLLILGLGLISAIALAAWAIFIKKDLSQFKAFIPRAPLGLLALYGLVFPAFNALFEEFMARAVLYDGFERILHHSVGIILSQAVVFAFWHYNGFPGGPIGVAMVFAWSVVLGYLRLRSRGMLAPLLAHYLADFAIVIILYFFVIKS